MSTCTVLIKDEVNVHLKGLDADTREDIVEAMSFFVPKYMFNPKYKLGRWDGRISLAKPSGYTFLNLASLWEPIVQRAGYTIKVQDNRCDWPELDLILPDENFFSDYEIKGKQIVLRDYQLDAIHTAVLNGSGLLELATGSGKSILCAALAKIYGEYGRVLIIVPSIDLVLQTAATFRSVGVDAGIWYGEMKEHKNVIVSTWQSLELTPELFHEVICVIVDETHLAAGKTISNLLSGPGANVPYRFGCTGTLPQDELYRKQINAVLGEKIFELSSWELQQQGVLADSNINILKLLDKRNPRYKKVMGEHEDWLEEVSWMAQDEARMTMVGDLIKQIATTGNTLVLTQYEVMGKALGAQLGTEYFYGKTRTKKRQARFKEIDGMDNQVLVASMGIASTGIDIPRLYNIVFIAVGKSATRVPQAIGRGLRKSDAQAELDAKDAITIWDISGEAEFEAKQLKERITIYNRTRHDHELIEIDYI